MIFLLLFIILFSTALLLSEQLVLWVDRRTAPGPAPAAISPDPDVRPYHLEMP